MKTKLSIAALCVLAACSAAAAGDAAKWWNPKWKYRTTVTRPAPYRGDAPRPVEAAVDFRELMNRAGCGAIFHLAGLRLVDRGTGREVPFAARGELDAETGRQRRYFAWIARPKRGRTGTFDFYFNIDHRAGGVGSFLKDVPPENLLANPAFADHTDGRPAGWDVSPAALVRVAEYSPAVGRALKIVVDGQTPPGAPREVTISQKIDVAKYAGCEMVFECDLQAERAAYGAPVSVRIEQFRKDASRIAVCAVDPRWTTIELAQGQLVRLRERGRFHHEAAAAVVRIRARCLVRDADTPKQITAAEAFFTVWIRRVLIRPGERWAWPPASNAGFVTGALRDAPLNRGFEFTGRRRLAFNGAPEATLTTGKYGGARSVHWGLAAGTLEFWCRPSWNTDDGAEHVFFHAVSYGHRLHSRLRKLDAGGKNRLEFSIADAGGTLRTLRGPAPLRAGKWHHVAATWDFPHARQQLFVDGKRIAAAGPGKKPWPSSTIAVGGRKKTRGIGISEADTRSLPMQAFIGGDVRCRSDLAAEAALDELRISDVARYAGNFDPPRSELKLDEHTRAMFHFENEVHGLHDSDDRFVRGHLACELPPQRDGVILEELKDGKVVRRRIVLPPRADDARLFEANRAETRLPVMRRFRELPDPRFVACVPKMAGRDFQKPPEPFELTVGGDYEPWMQATTFDRRLAKPAKTTPLPRWRANDNVVPFSAADLAATLAPNAPGDAERAFEAFKYALQVTNYYDAHYCETLPARHRPRVSYTLTKALNIYPFDQCGPLNYTLRKLFIAVGISSNDASGTHHQFEQAFYNGAWRLFDLSPRLYWLNRDNRTVAGRRAFEEDLYLKLRQDSGVTSALRGRPGQARYGTAVRPHCMDLHMQPGEKVSVCWHNEGRWFEVTGDRKPIPLAKVPPLFGNGAIVYQPFLGGDAAVLSNMGVSPSGWGPSTLEAKDHAKPADLIYRCNCPYILSDAQVGGEYFSTKPGDVRLLLSLDGGKSWKEVWRSAEKRGTIAADMLRHVTGRYAYWLKLAFAPGELTSVRGLKVRTTFVVSPLSLPGRLRLGKNRIRFVGPRPTVPIRTQCRWIERHRTKLGVSLEGLSYYLDGGQAHRSVIVAAPDRKTAITVALRGEPYVGEISLNGLPTGWLAGPARQRVETTDAGRPARATFTVTPKGRAGEVHGFDAAIPGGGHSPPRRVWGQVLLADAPLVREAESADEVSGKAAPADLPAASGRRIMTFTDEGKLGFNFSAGRAGTYALWLLARWEPGSGTAMRLSIDKGKARGLRAQAMIGFTDWTAATRAHTKMFAHYGEQYAHWSWYRIPDVKLAAGKHRLLLGAGKGACFDAAVLLPAGPAIDRAAMNLFQNWNYAPWHNPL